MLPLAKHNNKSRISLVQYAAIPVLCVLLYLWYYNYWHWYKCLLLAAVILGLGEPKLFPTHLLVIGFGWLLFVVSEDSKFLFLISLFPIISILMSVGLPILDHDQKISKEQARTKLILLLQSIQFHDSFLGKGFTIDNNDSSIIAVDGDGDERDYIITEDQCYSSEYLLNKLTEFTSSFHGSPEEAERKIEEMNNSKEIHRLLDSFNPNNFAGMRLGVAFGIVCVLARYEEDAAQFWGKIKHHFGIYCTNHVIHPELERKRYLDVLLLQQEKYEKDAPPFSLVQLAKPSNPVYFSSILNRTWMCLNVIRSIPKEDTSIWVWFLVDTGAPCTFLLPETIKLLYPRGNYGSSATCSMLADKTSIHDSEIQRFNSTLDFPDKHPARKKNLLGADIIWQFKFTLNKIKESVTLEKEKEEEEKN